MSEVQAKKRLHEGGVGPEMRSPAGLASMILGSNGLPVKVHGPMTAEEAA